MTHDDLHRLTRKSVAPRLRVAFDLDDTLIPSVHTFPLESPPRRWLGRLVARDRLRQGTTQLLRHLTAQGHELWIYTTSARPCWQIRQCFNVPGVRIAGVVNADIHARHVPPGRGCSKHPPAFGISLLVDDSPGVVLEGRQRGFRVVQVSPDDPGWADRVLAAVDALINSVPSKASRPGEPGA